ATRRTGRGRGSDGRGLGRAASGRAHGVLLGARLGRRGVTTSGGGEPPGDSGGAGPIRAACGWPLLVTWTGRMLSAGASAGAARSSRAVAQSAEGGAKESDRGRAAFPAGTRAAPECRGPGAAGS